MAKLFSWGVNFNGILGDGTTDDKSSPVQIGDTDNWAKVSCRNAGFAIKQDGTMWSWGENYGGTLGNGTTVNISSPVQIGLNSVWVDVKTNGVHAFAKKNNNTLWSWGVNYNGILGDNTTVNKSSPVQVGADSDWAEFATGEGFGAAIKENGTLWIWGNNYDGVFGNNSDSWPADNRSSPIQIGSDTNWAQVSCGEYCMAAIKNDGSLYAWGENNYGILGDGTTDSRSSPVQIGSDTWKQISLSPENNQAFALAIKSNGTLWAWGRNDDGQLGDNTTIYKSSPIQIGSETSWSYVAASRRTSYGIKADGSLWAWGYNDEGQLGNENTVSTSSPVQILTDKVGWIEISGNQSVLALYEESTTPTKSCSNLSCSTPAFKCYVGVTESCACARWKFYTAQCTRIQQSLGICSGTSGAYVPAITVCNQKLF